MKPAFIEEFDSPNVDPVDGQGRYDFPWKEVYERLGEAQDETQGDWSQLGEALHRLLQWVVGSNLTGDELERMIGRKAVALAWVIDPGLFRGSPSLRGLAIRLKHSNAMVMSHLTSEAAKTFGVQNRAQTTFGCKHVEEFKANQAKGDQPAHQ